MKRILPIVKRIGTPEPVHWVTGALVIGLGITLAQLTWLLTPQPSAAHSALVPAAIPSAEATPRLENIAALHLFGQPETVAPRQINAPETALNLTLRGLFASTRKEAAFAIVADGSGTESHYRVGGTLPGGVTVREILTDRLILERAGQYETLKLPKMRLELDNSTAGPATPATMNNLRENVITPATNPQKVFRTADLLPVMEKGQLKGYRLRPKQHKDLFQAAGLSAADIVLAINGTAVTDATQFAALATQLSTAQTVTLTVERAGGTRSEIKLNLN